MASIDLNKVENDVKLKVTDPDVNGERYLIVQTASGDETIGSITLAAGENHIGEVGGKMSMISAEFTRPSNTIAYSGGDCVGNSASAVTPIQLSNFARVIGQGGYIVGARLNTDKKSITPRFRVHLYATNNPTVAPDNVIWREVYSDITSRAGYFDLPAMSTATDTAISDMSRSLDFTLRIPFVCASGDQSLYYILETLDAFTPNSAEKFTLTLYGELN